MEVSEFQSLSLRQLEQLSKIDRHRWSRYLSGKTAINSRTLDRAANLLEMSPTELLEAINLRKLKSQTIV